MYGESEASGRARPLGGVKLRAPGPKRAAVLRCCGFPGAWDWKKGLLAELGKGIFFAGDFEGDLRGLGGYSSSIEAEEGDEGGLVSSTSGAASGSGSGSDSDSEGESSSSVSSPRGTGGAPCGRRGVPANLRGVWRDLVGERMVSFS